MFPVLLFLFKYSLELWLISGLSVTSSLNSCLLNVVLRSTDDWADVDLL